MMQKQFLYHFLYLIFFYLQSNALRALKEIYKDEKKKRISNKVTKLFLLLDKKKRIRASF